MTWDQIREGDVLRLSKVKREEGFVPLKLLPTCRNCHSPEVFRCVCDCSDPDCPRDELKIDVRRAFIHPGIIVVRDGEEVGMS